MWGTVFVYLISTLVALVTYYRWSRRKILAAVANMSGPPALPLIGHSYLLTKFTSTEAIFHNMRRIGEQYPSPVCFHIGPLIHISLAKPEELQILLNSPHCLSKPMQYEFFRVSKGLFAAPAHIWKGQRKILNLSFGQSMLNNFASIFNAKSAILVDQLSKYVGQEEQDIFRDIAKCNLDTIYSTAFGVDFDFQRTPEGEFYLGLQEAFIDIVTKRVFSPSRYPEFIYRLTNAFKEEQYLLQQARSLTTKVMEEKNAEELLSSKSQATKTADAIEGKKPQIFLDKLIELARENSQLSIDDIPEHLNTIIFAGNDTTATTMSSLLLMLAIHQDVQERVYQEIVQACPDKNQFVSLDDIAKLTYTEMVCKETMRLFPVGPILGRVSTSYVKLDDRNTIPPNSIVIGAIYLLHRDREIWGPDAEKFNPDNFLPDRVAKRHPYAFLPFSGGPRNCIGVRYAWTSMKIMIVYLLRNYWLKTSLTMDTISLQYSIILKIGNGCLITLKRRD